jgi:hypothetical protein
VVEHVRVRLCRSSSARLATSVIVVLFWCRRSMSPLPFLRLPLRALFGSLLNTEFPVFGHRWTWREKRGDGRRQKRCAIIFCLNRCCNGVIQLIIELVLSFKGSCSAARSALSRAGERLFVFRASERRHFTRLLSDSTVLDSALHLLRLVTCTSEVSGLRFSITSMPENLVGNGSFVSKTPTRFFLS